MEADDITIEVRDRDLAKVGMIPLSLLNLTLDVKHNNVGTWKVGLPSDHPLGQALRTPGAGIIISTPTTTLASGPMVKSIDLGTSNDPEGALTLEGVTDDIVLADMLAWPEPSNPNVETQAVFADVRTGPAETVMHAYVNANIGPAAPVARRRPLTLGVNGARGGTVMKSARFQLIGELIGEVALAADLGFSVTQRDDGLIFETYAVTDRTKEIRLDVRNGTLSAQKVTISAPEITDAILQGKTPRTSTENPDDANGDPVPNTVTEAVVFLKGYSNTLSDEAEAAWGRRIERFVSQQQTDDLAELQQSADETLAEKGFTQVGVQVMPMEGESMRFGRDWFLGDKVTVVADDVEYVSIVTGYKLRFDSNGFYLSADLGDPKNFDPTVALRQRVQDTGRRISALERNG